jgi:hypothetical protein
LDGCPNLLIGTWNECWDWDQRALCQDDPPQLNFRGPDVELKGTIKRLPCEIEDMTYEQKGEYLVNQTGYGSFHSFHTSILNTLFCLNFLINTLGNRLGEFSFRYATCDTGK